MQEAALAQLQSTQALLEQNKELTQGFGAKIMSIFNESATTLKETPIPSAAEAALKQLSDDVFSGMFWGVPLGFLLRRKVEGDPTQTPAA